MSFSIVSALSELVCHKQLSFIKQQQQQQQQKQKAKHI